MLSVKIGWKMKCFQMTHYLNSNGIYLTLHKDKALKTLTFMHPKRGEYVEKAQMLW